MTYHVAWFNGPVVSPSKGEGLTSPDPATYRRCLLPARKLEDQGFACSIFGNLSEANPDQVSSYLHKIAPDIVVILGLKGPSIQKLAQIAKHFGCYVIIDFADQIIETATCAELFPVVDLVVTASMNVTQARAVSLQIPTYVIPDSDDQNHPFDPILQVSLAWFHCFTQVSEKPPQCANSNVPEKVSP